MYRKIIIGGVFIFSLIFSLVGCGNVININVFKREKFDIIVVGGEPEGIASAISAAKNGAKVLLIDKHDGLGGLITYGMLNSFDMSYGPDGILLTQGTFKEFFEGIGSKYSFDVEKAKRLFMEMVKRSPNIILSLNTDFAKPIMEGNKIIGIVAVKYGKEVKYYGKRIIDATQDADVAASAGVPYTVGAEDIGLKNEFQAATLIFKLKGLDWDILKKIINVEKKISHSYINDTSAWGFLKITKCYKPHEPLLRLRGLNLGRQEDGTVLVNALLIFGVNGLDKKSVEEGKQRAEKELPYIIDFFRKNIPGFEKIELDGIAPELYIRETRHINGLYTLGINDVIFNKDFEDRIAIGSYPIDIQPTSPHSYGHIYGSPIEYSIPFRCIVPQKVENLLVVGRAASYSHLASGSARTIPIGMAVGDAAGVAAVYSLKNNLTFKEVAENIKDIKNIQEILIKQGAYLKPFKIDNEAEKHWSIEGLKFVLRWGLFPSGFNPGYDNNYRFEEPINGYVYNYMLSNMILRAIPSKKENVINVENRFKRQLNKMPINKLDAIKILLLYAGIDIGRGKGEDANWEHLLNISFEKGIISRNAYNHIKGNDFISWADTYDMTHSLYLYLNK
ncbi:thiamine biosynthesis protein [Thermoanaerobacter sp. YS13]|uniref:FAD-dependent oxidoreductase n=1 Tax=Thermoanaerobacter sp. YS13 TaxID=1511746 RepID=UPI0005736DFA|nr:FAD-dependent oxidoreductase [Thermoanaerobacter sp. YS13]KHO61733.1 thiamine biosynthesis protein [Thermoanaerobacter sp. YS13]